MTKRRLGLVGYYGYGNYGDELFLDVFRKYLEQDFELVFLQDILKRPYYLSPLDDKVRDLDAILIGGGDLVIPDYWTDQYFEDAFLAKPIYMHGIGVPTWGGENERVVERLAKFFQHDNVRQITVRDRESKAWIEKKLAPRVEVLYTPDIVCALDLPSVERPSDPPIFGLVSRKQKPGEIQWQNVRALCEKAVSLGYRIRHIVLATGIIGEEDRQAAEELALPGVETIASENIEDLTRAIGECTVLASMKFHGCVVASMFGIPAIMLITTDKFRNFYKLLEREELVAHHRHPDLPDRLSRFMAKIPYASRHNLRQKADDGLVKLAAKIKQDIGFE
ncbi:polysaccharide pyruvyl transferase family protein [Microvirga sp. VF16]|uniref:polysaccharide pyruvyl transferase family protein n=1 Tax=Microvirga sp. VF16 TaxID=2807101 RepID=UPI00193CECE3|nr:polysaccharide pyruvyl transferase family protein [Microvirga sp. VF16]QRM35614.1 polysaccharide pyruvyl transferase family protein [Microvirga sp. VF16]